MKGPAPARDCQEERDWARLRSAGFAEEGFLCDEADVQQAVCGDRLASVKNFVTGEGKLRTAQTHPA